MPAILLVEDDAAVAEPLSVALENEGYAVDRHAAGRPALAALASGGYDLVLLDLGLPDLDGLEVCREVARRRPGLPVLILTARADEVDTVVGLNAGAYDYVVKPFRLAELLARMRAVLRRADPSADIDGVRVDPAGRRAWLGGTELVLSAKEFELLWLLVREAGTLVPRSRVAAEVWQGQVQEGSRTIDVHISALRRKLGDDGRGGYIHTVRGVGFQFRRAG